MKLRLLQHLHAKQKYRVPRSVGRAVGAWRGQAAKPTLLKFMCFIKMNSKWGRLRNQLWKNPGCLKNEAKIHTHTEKKRQNWNKNNNKCYNNKQQQAGATTKRILWILDEWQKRTQTHTNNTQAQINNSHTRRVRKREEGQRVAKSIAYFSAYTNQVTTKGVVASVCVFEWVCLCVFVCMYSRTGAE